MKYSIKTCTAKSPIRCEYKKSFVMRNTAANIDKAFLICTHHKNCMHMTQLHFIKEDEKTTTLRSEKVFVTPKVRGGVKIPDMNVENWKCINCGEGITTGKHSYNTEYSASGGISVYTDVVCHGEKKDKKNETYSHAWTCPVCNGHKYGYYRINRTLEYYYCNRCSVLFALPKCFDKENLK